MGVEFAHIHHFAGGKGYMGVFHTSDLAISGRRDFWKPRRSLGGVKAWNVAN